MDEDARTIWCGNLSSKCTEDILYELFLQAGPLEKVNIPKDRDGTIKSFGFITYKHKISVPYALNLFEGTSLFNRVLTLKARQNPDLKNVVQLQTPWKTNITDKNSILQYGQPFFNNSHMFNLNQNLLPLFIPPGVGLYPSQVNSSFAPVQQDRRPQRNHPYNRDRDNNRDRDRERERERDRNHSHRNHHNNKNNNKDHNKDNHKNHKSNQRSHHYHGRNGRNNR